MSLLNWSVENLNFKSKFKGYLFQIQFTQYGKEYLIKTCCKNDYIARQRVKLHYPFSHINNITCLKVIND